MAENEPTKLPSSLPLIVTIALVTAAVLISRLPLESSRPRPPSGLEPVVLDTNVVDAALWQDPFEVALNHEREFHRGSPDSVPTTLRSCSSSHCVNLVGPQIGEEIRRRRQASAPRTDVGPRRMGDSNNRSPAVHILMMMVRDEWSAEDHERRLRNRYALLAALRAQGMGPAQGKHIQYFRVLPAEWKWSPQPLAFPFEWFAREGLYAPDPARDDRPGRVLVLWLPQSVFEAEPLKRILWLLQKVGQYLPECDLSAEIWKKDGLVRADLIGPAFSTVLDRMLFEIHRGDVPMPSGGPPPGDRNRWLRIYSPCATASPALLVRHWKKAAGPTSAARMLQVIPEHFATAGIEFIPMIGTDDMLAKCIIEELGQRGVNVLSESDGDQIVLISEWDTFYGRAFPLTFGAMMRALGKGKRASEGTHTLNWNTYARGLAASLREPDTPKNLHLYTYLNGVDGRLPEVPGQEADTPATSAGTASKWTYSENLELPMGQGQLDYVRRLAQKLHDDFRGLGRPRLKAVGVVGSDVYDKLILLHALREEFGNILLFTVDLDARLLDHEQLKWTRNVLVVSNYGLELNPIYYRETHPRTSALADSRSAPPPFRENYQAALFLACRTALGLRRPSYRNGSLRLRDLPPEDLASLLTQPRVFEVGRRGAVDLDMSRDPTGLHPPRERWYTKRGPGLPLAVVVVCLGITTRLWTPVARGLCGTTPWACRDAGGVYVPAQHRVFRKAVFLALALFSGIVIYSHYAPFSEERFSLSNGISAWPGLALWLITVLVGLHFGKRALRIIQESNAELARSFDLDPPPDTPSLRSHVQAIKPKARSFAGLLFPRPHPGKAVKYVWPAAKRLFLRAFQDSADYPPVNPDGTVDAQRLWKDYLTSGHCHLRIVRTVVRSVLLFGVLLGVRWLWGAPFVPCRGFWSVGIYRLFIVLLPSLLFFLVFFTLDAIRLCLRLVDPLIVRRTDWPRRTTQAQFDDSTVPWSDREGWMDVRFIARLTEAQGKLLYLPSLVLLLIIAGRFWYFDNWGYPLQVVLVYAAVASWLGLCAVGLMSAAQRTRTAALDNLNETLRRIDPGAQADRIKDLMEDIRSIKKGAFRPLAESPVMHFLLIPSGGVGLLTLLAYLLPT